MKYENHRFSYLKKSKIFHALSLYCNAADSMRLSMLEGEQDETQ